MNYIKRKQRLSDEPGAIRLKGEQKLQPATGKIFSIFFKNGYQ